MKRAIVPLFMALTLAACGGGGNNQPATKATAVSFYGNPLPQASPASLSKAAIAHAASDAGASSVQTLTDALAAQGVTATVTPQVMNGTTLHELIIGENSGLPPTNDQFKTDPNGWLVVNFQLDDMVTDMDDPAQQAALLQFQNDVYTFIQRAHVSGKLTFIIMPIPTCDAVTGHSAADGLIKAITYASSQSGGFPVGSTPMIGVTDPTTFIVTNTYTQGHLGADCRTPDAYLLNAWTTSIAAAMAPALKQGLPTQ